MSTSRSEAKTDNSNGQQKRKTTSDNEHVKTKRIAEDQQIPPILDKENTNKHEHVKPKRIWEDQQIPPILDKEKRNNDEHVKPKRIAEDQQIAPILDNEKTNNESPSCLDLKNCRNVSFNNSKGKKITFDYAETTDTFKICVRDKEGRTKNYQILLSDQEIQKDTMQISVKSNGEINTLEVDAFETIQSVQERIQNGKEKPLTKQVLLFDGQILYDDLTISHYEIQNSSLLRSRSVIRILVKTRTTIPLIGEPSATIEKLKAMIERFGKIPIYRQLLVHNGVKLEDGRTLSDYNIQNKSIIWVNEKIQIFVKKHYGNTFTLDVDTSDTINDVKAEIQKKEGLLPIQQRLWFSGQSLENDQTISNCNIEHGATLHLLVRHLSSQSCPNTNQ